MAFAVVENKILFIFLANGLWWIAADAFEKSTFNLDQFRRDLLETTNEKRALHGVPPLQLKSALNDYAQEWADHTANTRRPVHSPSNSYGENLFGPIIGHKTASEIVNRWYNEIDNYNFITQDAIDPTEDIGHFTQLVWNDTKYLGVGAAFLNSTHVAWYVVANFDPAGNYGGRDEYEMNVPIPIHGQEDFQFNLDQYRQDLLNSMNKKRALHGVPSLYINSYANGWGQRTAEDILYNNKSYREPYFELKNPISEVFSTCVGCPASFHVDRWYDQMKNWNFETGTPINQEKPYLEFVALIWKSMEFIGVGLACDDATKLMVVHVIYYPVRGNTTTELLPPLST